MVQADKLMTSAAGDTIFVWDAYARVLVVRHAEDGDSQRWRVVKSGG